jgi:lipopolysaccharide export LptBFGC system permease protein LptF
MRRTSTPLRRSLPRSYALWMLAQIAIQSLLIVALVEGIFLSEHFIDIFKDSADEIGTAIYVIYLVLLTAPEVHFALPIAMLVAVYLVILRCRERSELLALAGVGLGGRQMIILALVVGIVGQAASFVITGSILPQTRFVFRSSLLTFRNEAIVGGGAAGHFYSFPGYTVFKWPGQKAAEAAALFIFESRESGFDRAISADGAHILGSVGPDRWAVGFNEITAVNVPSDLSGVGTEVPRAATSNNNCEGCSIGAENTLRLDNYVRSLDLTQLTHLDPRGSSPGEWSVGELLGISSAPHGDLSAVVLHTELISRLIPGLLCLIAPFFGLLGVGWTNRVSQAFALPIVCGFVLFLDVAVVMLAQTLIRFGLIIGLGGVLAVFGCLLVVLVWQIESRAIAIIKPALTRA